MRNARLWTAGLMVLSLAGCGTRVSLDAGASGGRVTLCADEGRPAKNVGKGMANKFARGFVNALTGWIEWPMQTYKGYEHGVSFVNKGQGGWSKTVGVLKGLILSGPGYAIGRTGSGMVELGGFWTANRPDNAGIGSPLDDEFAWEEGKPYSMFEPSFEEGVKPYGRKFVHGVTNGLLGWVEFPGQIVKGVREDKVGMGIVKCIWYPLSRTASGFGDAFTFLFPNPKDTCGYAWEDKWAWSALTNDTAAPAAAPAKKK